LRQCRQTGGRAEADSGQHRQRTVHFLASVHIRSPRLSDQGQIARVEGKGRGVMLLQDFDCSSFV
jgi:hypothetical protein